MNYSTLPMQLRSKIDEINRSMSVDEETLIGLLIAYSVLILTGTTGNCLVCFIVARKPHMRNPRNAYIVNLAISDLLLCLFTMPFTLLQIVFKYWPLGVLMCKLVAALQATSIFVSTISITAIALDRYGAIIHPAMNSSCQPCRSFLMLSSIWAISLLCSVPLFLSRTIVDGRADLEERIPPSILQYVRPDMDYCIERWTFFGVENGRLIFSGISMLLQYVMPISIVTISYQRICKKLRRRMEEKSQATQIERNREKAERNFKRTNKLLISISLIFGLSWLPLNLINAFADLNLNDSFDDRKSFLIIFALCHMIGMSSACFNPLLYGWLNDTFRKEFTELFQCFRCKDQPSGGSGHNGSPESMNFSKRKLNSYDRTETQLIPAGPQASPANGSLKQNGSVKPNNNELFSTKVDLAGGGHLRTTTIVGANGMPANSVSPIKRETMICLES